MSILRTTYLFPLLAAALFLSACAADDEDLSLELEANEEDQEELEAAGKADSIDSTLTFYTLRHDTRRCVSPFCGGYWVKRANRAKTKCADGQYAAECYVGKVDVSNLGLSEEEQTNLLGLGATVVYRGSLEVAAYEQSDIDIAQLIASEAWMAGASEVEPDGVFYRVDANNIVCITQPCPPLFHEAKLNSTLSTDVRGFTGPFADKLDDILTSTHDSVLASGWNERRQGKKKLHATQFYVRVVPAPPVDSTLPAEDLACETQEDCVLSGYQHEISSPDECYCVVCPTTPMNVAAKEKYRTSWEAQCQDVNMTCPTYACRFMVPACVDNVCTFGQGG